MIAVIKDFLSGLAPPAQAIPNPPENEFMRERPPDISKGEFGRGVRAGLRWGLRGNGQTPRKLSLPRRSPLQKGEISDSVHIGVKSTTQTSDTKRTMIIRQTG